MFIKTNLTMTDLSAFTVRVEEEKDVALGQSCTGQPGPDQSVTTFQPQQLHLRRELPLDVSRQLTLHENNPTL